MTGIKRHLLPICTLALISGIAASSAHAGEIQRLRLALNGNGVEDVVILKTSKANEDWRRRFTVEIARSKYSGDYFSADGDTPSVREIAIDRNRKERQLLVDTPEAGSCVFHILSFASKRLTSLLRFDSGPDCNPPVPQGNGTLRILTWQGFWNKNETLRLSKDGKALVLEQQDKFWVNVAGSAGTGLTLQGATCASRDIPLGTFVSVKFFEPKGNRYMLESADGGCG
jgi:hypothetical protein